MYLPCLRKKDVFNNYMQKSFVSYFKTLSFFCDYVVLKYPGVYLSIKNNHLLDIGSCILCYRLQPNQEEAIQTEMRMKDYMEKLENGPATMAAHKNVFEETKKWLEQTAEDKKWQVTCMEAEESL